MRFLLALFLASGLAFAATTNAVNMTNVSGSTATNQPMKIHRFFKQGEFPLGTFPQPAVGGNGLGIYQTNVIHRWRDIQQTATTINSVANGPAPAVCLTFPGSTPGEGDVLTFAGNTSIPDGQYAIVGVNSLSPFCGYLPGAVSMGTTTDGSVTAPDLGSIEEAYIILPYSSASVTYDVNGNVTAGLQNVSFISATNPCNLGNQATCDAAALTQTQMLNFNSGNWDMQVSTTANSGNCAGSFDFRTAVAAGDWTYLIKGPLLTEIKIENLSTLAYDYGCRDLDTTVLTQLISATANTFTVGDCFEANALIVANGSTPGVIVPIHQGAVATPETMTFTSCNTTTNVATVTRGAGALANNIGSNIRFTAAPTGGTNSWQERPLGTGRTITAAATTMYSGGADLYSGIFGQAPYVIRIDDEHILDAGTITSLSNGGNVHTFTTRGVDSTTAVAHTGNPWVYATPWASNWVTATDAAHKSLHPVGYASFYTPDGLHQWPGVFETVAYWNAYLHKMQDQFYVLTILTGAAHGTTKVNGDRVAHPANTPWRRSFWDGTAPGGTDCPYETFCGVAVDYNLAYLASTGITLPFDTSFAISQSEINSVLASYCNNFGGAISARGQCSGTPPTSYWYYTQPGQYALYEGASGGRQENSTIPHYTQAALYAMNVTTQQGITNTLNMAELFYADGEAIMHRPFYTIEDSATAKFDDLGLTNAIGRTISRDAHPKSGVNINPYSWLNNCATIGTDCPGLVGMTENIAASISSAGGRAGDQVLGDPAHSGTNPWAQYTITGDDFLLQGVYHWGGNAVRDSLGSGQGSGQQSWGLIYFTQMRAFGWMWRDLVAAAILAPDNTAEQRYFRQKIAYNAEAAEGWMLLTSPNCYFCGDSNTASKYYWGLHTQHVAGLTNPLGAYFPALGECGQCPLGIAPCVAPLENPPYTEFAGVENAPWQSNFVTIPMSIGYKAGLNQLKFVRQSQAQFQLGFVNQASNSSQIGNVSNFYFPIRRSSNSGLKPLVGAGGVLCNILDATQTAMATWSEVFANICVDSASGCSSNQVGGTTGAVARWTNTARRSQDEDYAMIEYAGAAINSDVTTGTSCPAGSTPPCNGLQTWQWLAQNIPGLAAINLHEWLFVPAGAPPPCTIVTTTLPGGRVGTLYSQPVQVSGCTGPSFSITGSLPGGLSIGPTSGIISGIPTTAGTFNFTVVVTTSSTGNPTQSLSIGVGPASGPGTVGNLRVLRLSVSR